MNELFIAIAAVALVFGVAALFRKKKGSADNRIDRDRGNDHPR